jgi:hypothetical protein
MCFHQLTILNITTTTRPVAASPVESVNFVDSPTKTSTLALVSVGFLPVVRHLVNDCQFTIPPGWTSGLDDSDYLGD